MPFAVFLYSIRELAEEPYLAHTSPYINPKKARDLIFKLQDINRGSCPSCSSLLSLQTQCPTAAPPQPSEYWEVLYPDKGLLMARSLPTAPSLAPAGLPCLKTGVWDS